MYNVNVTLFIESPYVKSFLFECAKYWASEGSRVLYISNKEQTELPPSVKGTGKNSAPYAEFANITFVTAPDAAGLTDFLINLPKLPHIPKVLVVEDVTSYVKTSHTPDPDFWLLCSLLKQTADTCWRFHKNVIYLILSIKFEPDKLNALNFIINPRKIWKTVETPSDDDRVKNFTLREISTNPVCDTSQSMEFSLFEKTDEQFLRLNNIETLFEESCNFNNKVF